MKENNCLWYEHFDIERPFDFRLHTSMGCGGVAKFAIYPHSEAECIRVCEELSQRGQSFLVVGNLTNVLVSDLGTDKLVICTKKMQGITQIDDTHIYAEAGVGSGNLLTFLRRKELSGLAFLTGIPCTVGGALYMNAGVQGHYIADALESVRVWQNGQVQTLLKEECDYRYKHSCFMASKALILGATFCLKQGDIADISEEERRYRVRRAHLPKGKSVGCIFKNPEGNSAGALIERAGLKGLRVGGAVVSAKHANFIINDGNATAREVHALIKLVQNAVFAYSGIFLEEEIQYID